MKRALAILSALLMPVSLQAAELKGDFEAGHQFALQFDPEQVTHDRFYLVAKEELTFDTGGETPSNFDFVGQARGWIDTPNGVDRELTLRELWGAWSRGPIKLQLGYQQVAWGETFGVYIADIVNPRDWRDPLFNELGWVRLPIFAANAQVFLDALTLQFVVTPVPRNGIYPSSIVAPPGFDVGRFGMDAEYGGRASYLFASGLDLGAFAYRHWNRQPVYELEFDPATLQAAIAPVVSQVNSFGLTASQSAGSFVFRADSVLNLDQPIQAANFLPAPRVTQWQNILGTDWTPDTGVTLGAQFHTEVNSIAFEDWASFMARKNLFGDLLVSEVFVFFGINNPDLWVQPKLIWNLTRALSVQLRADFVSASTSLVDGALPLVRDQSRFFSWVSYRF